MQIGGFQLNNAADDIDHTSVFAILRPWIDVNNVGTMVLNELERQFNAIELGRLSRPGNFYDFTRYRPTIHIDEEGIKDIRIPNTTVKLIKREGQDDIILLRLLEPHNNAEFFIYSIMKLLKKLKASRYTLLGSMYDTVPHTRPLLISGYGMGDSAIRDIGKINALPIVYHGPSTIVNLITKGAAESGIDATAFIVSIPQYVVLEEDYIAKVRLMEILNMLYGIPINNEDIENAREQLNIINERIKNTPEIKVFLPQLEGIYDTRIRSTDKGYTPSMSPEMDELFWKTMGKDDDIGRA
ncbi:MAG TPA: PAC2 family protein [Syntrophorhabdaceae bacterium]|nr:PAC2 family protein [Syntrophorhabdaceae bacterium]HOT42159.1 PAC2 family protein [Syntrophorhabdaceae bacterium]HPC67321.1 PAC2 family protein [Syntrophorhabdaceae bacterium]HQE80442.1 PAC2 family protein [Syntrophorhabdaceae bacterium]HQH42882.1 PAC2 family protein [Syntrophorhabdaceae bacterium]